ncbi:MAG TPA: hypothetical protein VGL38_02720 [bacterium]|jgi:hypothetical protein
MVKRIFFVLFALLITAASPAMAQGVSAGYRFVAPTTFDRKVELLISGKRREYYALEQGKQLQITVQGPSRLRIVSRVLLDSPKDTADYGYVIQRKNGKTFTIVHTAGLSDKALMAGEGAKVVGESRSKVMDVPQGDQTFVFTLPKNTKRSVIFRFAVETNEFTAGAPVVAMTPADFTKEVDLTSGEKTVPYYRVGTGFNVALKIIGPATIKVLSRIEFDQSMNGKQKWKVQVAEDGKVKAVYPLSAGRSDTIAYHETSSLVASWAETFFIEVPQGEHRYEFTLPDNHRTALLRFLLPKNQLVRE